MQRFGLLYVCRAWLGIAAGMVVGEKQARGLLLQRQGHQQAYVDYRGPAPAQTEHLLVYQALAFVEKEHPALLVLESFEAGDEQVIDHPRAD